MERKKEKHARWNQYYQSFVLTIIAILLLL